MLPVGEGDARNLFDGKLVKAISSSDPMEGCSNADSRIDTPARVRSNSRYPLFLLTRDGSGDEKVGRIVLLTAHGRI